MRCISSSGFAAIVPVRHERAGITDKCRRSTKNSTELRKRRADLQTLGSQLKFSNCILVNTAAFLNNGQRSPNPAIGFEISQHDHRIAQVTQIYRRIHAANQAVLSQDHEGQNPQLIEVGKKLVHLKDEKALVRHRVEVSVQAVDQHHARFMLFHCIADEMCEFARGHLCGIDLFDRH